MVENLFQERTIMAVPKKRTSKAKRNARKANWKRKSYTAAQKSLSLAKSMLRGKPTSFVYSVYMEEKE
jgi:large subunit ribosomal protein L32